MNDVAEVETTGSSAGIRSRQMLVALALFAATFVTTTYIGALQVESDPFATGRWTAGLAYSIPLMAILLAHEFGHFIAAGLHRVPASLPFFVPMPLPPLGTMGAVIFMRDRIARRDALLDIGAAGPLAGIVVAIPVLIYGIAQSPVKPLPVDAGYWMEGRSLLYLGLLYLVKGPIPEGHDIMLTPTAFAGWAGLLVTMINLIPVAQLDGGHVAYALFGERQQRYSRRIRFLLLPLAAAVSLAYGIPAWLDGARGDALIVGLEPGIPWLSFWVLLSLMTWSGPPEHPPTDDETLSPRRRLVAVGTLVLFVLLFMPAWLRQVPAPS